MPYVQILILCVFYLDWCSPGQYICAGSRACVNRMKVCDGKRDCPRGDDENECVKIDSGKGRAGRFLSHLPRVMKCK